MSNARPSLFAQLAEAERLFNAHERMYPSWIEHRRIAPNLAQERLERQKGIVRTLKMLIERAGQPTLFD